jgi:hypothetical protein
MVAAWVAGGTRDEEGGAERGEAVTHQMKVRAYRSATCVNYLTRQIGYAKFLNVARLTRRSVLAGVPILGAGALAVRASATPGAPLAAAAPTTAHGAAGHAQRRRPLGRQWARPLPRRRGRPRRQRLRPARVLRDFDRGATRRLPSGRVLREWTLSPVTRRSSSRPACASPRGAYNGRIPGPTLRAREGERVRVTFVNGSDHPHTIHFHGIHRGRWRTAPGAGAGAIAPGRRTVYEFDAEPFGLHLYHCHARPLAEHIAKGLYGAFMIDPRRAAGRGRARDGDERVRHELRPRERGLRGEHDRLRLHGTPIEVARDELVRIYLVNVLEYDLLNSFHVHGNFFHYFPTGTRASRPSTRTRHAVPGPARDPRAALSATGRFMFHAHQSEFAELGWQGFFEVRDGLAGVAGLCRSSRARRRVAAGPAAARAADRRGRRRSSRSARPASASGAGRRPRTLAVERTRLEPGAIELTVRNDGPDAVRSRRSGQRRVRLVHGRRRRDRAARVGDPAHQPPVGRGRGVRGRARDRRAAATIAHEIPVAVATPAAGPPSTA